MHPRRYRELQLQFLRLEARLDGPPLLLLREGSPRHLRFPAQLAANDGGGEGSLVHRGADPIPSADVGEGEADVQAKVDLRYAEEEASTGKAITLEHQG